MALDAITTLQRRVETIELSAKEAKQAAHKLQRDAVFLIMAGAVGALVIVLIIIVAVDLWAR